MKYIHINTIYKIAPFFRFCRDNESDHPDYVSFCVKQNDAIRYESHLSHSKIRRYHGQVKHLMNAMERVFRLCQKNITYIVPEENGRYFFNNNPFAHLGKGLNKKKCISTESGRLIRSFLQSAFLPSCYQLAFSSNDFSLIATPTDHMDVFFYIHKDLWVTLTQKEELLKGTDEIKIESLST